MAAGRHTPGARGHGRSVPDACRNDGNIFHGAPRIRRAGRPGAGHRLRQRKDQGHQRDVGGPLGLRHYRSKWQTDEHPGVYRHASTGAVLRDGREPQTLTHRDRSDTKRFVKSEYVEQRQRFAEAPNGR